MLEGILGKITGSTKKNRKVLQEQGAETKRIEVLKNEIANLAMGEHEFIRRRKVAEELWAKNGNNLFSPTGKSNEVHESPDEIHFETVFDHIEKEVMGYRLRTLEDAVKKAKSIEIQELRKKQETEVDEAVKESDQKFVDELRSNAEKEIASLGSIIEKIGARDFIPSRQKAIETFLKIQEGDSSQSSKDGLNRGLQATRWFGVSGSDTFEAAVEKIAPGTTADEISRHFTAIEGDVFGIHRYDVTYDLRDIEDSLTRTPEMIPYLQTLASQIHDSWRLTRKKEDGSYDPRIKETKDEEWIEKNGARSVDITKEYKDLPQDWQQENFESAIAAFRVVLGEIKKNPEVNLDQVIEDMSAMIHEAWINRRIKEGYSAHDPKWEWATQLMVPYDQLIEKEPGKEADRKIIRSTITFFKQQFGSK